MGNILSANLAYMQLITRYTLHLFILVSLNFSKLHEKKKACFAYFNGFMQSCANSYKIV